jgi:hypothetical protein
MLNRRNQLRFPAPFHRFSICCHERNALRLSDMSERIETVIGPSYSASWRKDVVIPDLSSTVDTAVADGVEAAVIWRAVCNFVEVPSSLR